MRRVEALPLGEHCRVRQLRVNAPMMYDDETGCHIVMVTEYLQPPRAPLETVAPRLRAILACAVESDEHAEQNLTAHTKRR